ncbi:beta-galactosidase 9-like [Humulus lupulus]|uniref:beta-galactosidase 9-like n=1 Tax=Humulus lupulus TaxID=3486 RepID=UPI002B40A2F9|nr:beta-galactosidase 9-like [Humulus lupulus]
MARDGCARSRTMKDYGTKLCRPQDSLHTFFCAYDIENEYGNIEGKFGQKGKDYVKLAAKMALSLGAGVPWVMCMQTDAPNEVVRF